LWLTIGLALVFVIVSYINALYGWHWPAARRILSHFLDQLQLPALFVGSLISGNAEAPNAIAVHVTLFLTYIILFGSLSALIGFVYRKIRQHKGARAKKI
jgi:predicted permease